jgi:uncharacterized protein (DUF2249 family)
MEATLTNEGAKRKEIHLLERPHGECHQSVIEGLDQVAAGGSALIIADHDAKPVLYQYQAECHRLIFEKFDQLKPAESFILVSDHDPKPLYYQFAADREGEITREYLEKGPQAWRVRIGKE